MNRKGAKAKSRKNVPTWATSVLVLTAITMIIKIIIKLGQLEVNQRLSPHPPKKKKRKKKIRRGQKPHFN